MRHFPSAVLGQFLLLAPDFLHLNSRGLGITYSAVVPSFCRPYGTGFFLAWHPGFRFAPPGAKFFHRYAVVRSGDRLYAFTKPHGPRVSKSPILPVSQSFSSGRRYAASRSRARRYAFTKSPDFRIKKSR
jgi:hypothetical protein